MILNLGLVFLGLGIWDLWYRIRGEKMGKTPIPNSKSPIGYLITNRWFPLLVLWFLNRLKKWKKKCKKMFLLRQLYTLYEHFFLKIWSHFFPLLFPKDSFCLNSLHPCCYIKYNNGIIFKLHTGWYPLAQSYIINIKFKAKKFKKKNSCF